MTWKCMYGPFPVTVTTRIIQFLVGNPYRPLFATVAGKGPHPIYIYIHIYIYILFKHVDFPASRISWSLQANRLTPTLRKAKHTNGAENPKRQILNNHVLQPVMGPKAEELGNPIPKKVGRDFISKCFFLILREEYQFSVDDFHEMKPFSMV